MRLEYTDAQEAKLRITEIQALLENEEFSKGQERALIAEQQALEETLQKAGYDPDVVFPSVSTLLPSDDDMTRDGIFQTIKRRLEEHIRSGETSRWEEINTSVILLPPYPYDHSLAVWGEVADNKRKYYSVSIVYTDGADDENPVRWSCESYDTSDAELEAAINLALDKFQSIKWYDPSIRQAWAALEDVPVNGDTECLEQDFLWFPVGTDKADIWGWFNRNYSRGIRALWEDDSDEQTSARMSEADMRIALTALLESFIDNSKAAGVSHGEICSALSRIFSAGNLAWLGYGEYEKPETEEQQETAHHVSSAESTDGGILVVFRSGDRSEYLDFVLEVFNYDDSFMQTVRKAEEEWRRSSTEFYNETLFPLLRESGYRFAERSFERYDGID